MRSMHGVLSSMLVLGLTCPGATSGGRSGTVASGRGAAVRPGLEVLLSDSARLVRGRRVALLTNPAGVDHLGRSSVEVLRGAGVRLVALFSPEHGLRGSADPGAPVPSTVDSATGLPIYSLYGATSAPTDAMLSGVDVVLVDLQDVGARYFTYLWTTTEVMHAASLHGIPVVVLDRPNPLGGAVQGNVLDPAYRSAVGLLPVPMRHGMTLGELARLANAELGLGSALTVVPAAGWRRSMYFEDTGLPFVAPSPNLRSMEALLHYPGLCLFEGTTLSVGRGTDHPFEQVGAPWLDTTAVLAALRGARLPGVAFDGVTFFPARPGDGKFADTLVRGIRLRAVDRRAYDPASTALAMLDALSVPGALGGHPLFPATPAHFERLLGSSVLGPDGTLPPGESWRGLASAWPAADAAFRLRRRPYLIYPEQ